MQPPPHPLSTGSERHESSIWLPTAAGSLLRLIRESGVLLVVDKRRLLGTLGQLVQQVLATPSCTYALQASSVLALPLGLRAADT